MSNSNVKNDYNMLEAAEARLPEYFKRMDNIANNPNFYAEEALREELNEKVMWEHIFDGMDMTEPSPPVPAVESIDCPILRDLLTYLVRGYEDGTLTLDDMKPLPETLMPVPDQTEVDQGNFIQQEPGRTAVIMHQDLQRSDTSITIYTLSVHYFYNKKLIENKYNV